jgi:peptide/nickel transport system substrate-binding protein/microcin C transport system substrate-binding protein
MNSKILRILFVGTLLSAILVAGAINAQTKKWAEPNPKAPKGGSMVRNLGGEPPTIHPVMYSDLYAQYLLSDYLSDTLLSHDSNTFEWKPRIAEKWEISKDNKVFTFHLRKDAVFHDGKPITAEDVKFSLDAIFIKEFQAADKIPYYESVEKVEVVDPLTVKFYLKDTYFQNFETVATLYIIPKHVYSDITKAKEMTRVIVGAGPYVLEKFERGQRIVLRKFDNWYGNKDPQFAAENNFQTITIRFIKEAAVEMEAVKKGDVDYAWPVRPEDFVKAEGPMFGKTVFKVQAENSYPKGYGFIGWNFKKDLFKDKDIRLALAYLFNREEMNKKFRYGKSVPATGPTYVQSDYSNPEVKAIPFDPKKAAELLSKAGWKDSDKDGVLDKMVNGKKVDFRFSLNHANKDSEKYYTIYKEDLKKAGIDMDIKYMEWNSFIKMLDEKNFEAVSLAWSASIDWDPKQIWHSSSAVSGGSNFISYKNAAVDKLIETARLEVNRKKRITALRKVYKMIADDAPYIWMFNNKYELYMVSDKVQRSGDTMKYENGHNFWWAKQP